MPAFTRWGKASRVSLNKETVSEIYYNSFQNSLRERYTLESLLDRATVIWSGKKNSLLSPISIEGDIALSSVSALSISGRGRSPTIQYTITISSSPCGCCAQMQKHDIKEFFEIPHGFAKILKQRNLCWPAVVDLNPFDEEQDRIKMKSRIQILI